MSELYHTYEVRLQCKLLEHRANALLLRAKIFQTKMQLYALERLFLDNDRMTDALVGFTKKLQRVEDALDRSERLISY